MLPPLPFHSAIDLGSDELFSWRIRLEIERQLRNITDAHKAIIGFVADLAEAGQCEQTHAGIAATLRRGARTVRDALQRARTLGLIDWQPQYETRPGSVLRRRRPNLYRRTMPQSVARLRPDVRRHRRSHDGGGMCRAIQEERKEARERASGQRHCAAGAGMARGAATEGDLLTARQAAVLAQQRAAMRAKWQGRPAAA